MLGKKPMTHEERRERNNCLRREKLKKIKAENGAEYQNHSRRKREEGNRRIRRLKTENWGKGYLRRLRMNRETRKRRRAENIEKYREIDRDRQGKYKNKLRTQNDVIGHRESLAKRRKKERQLYKKHRDELDDSYIKKLLIDQGLKKDDISEKQIINKRNQLLLRRKLRPQRRQVLIKQKELSEELAKENEIHRNHLRDNNMKRCCRCKEIKLFKDFSPCRTENPSYASICKFCECILNKEKKKREGNVKGE